MRTEIKELLAAVIPYLVAVAAAYLFGYWGTFNINVLEFVSLADLAKLAVYPLLASLIFFLAGLLTSQFLVSPKVTPGGGANTTVGRIGRKYWRLFLGLQVVVICMMAIYGPEPRKWIVVASLVALFSAPLSHLEFLIERIPNPRARMTSLFLVLLLPGIAFAFGRQEAYLIKSGHPNQTVDIKRSNLPLSEDATKPVAYLGFVGGTYILYETKTEQLVLVKQQDNSQLYLTPRKR
jgi:hypothetical protein